MSADNWAACPKCSAARKKRFAERSAEVNAAYGTLPIAEFDAMRASLDADMAVAPDLTFREDYEFYGAEEGTVYATYSGGCSECGLRVKLEHSRHFFPEVSQ